MKRLVFIMSFVLVFSFSILGHADAARPTYLNRHYFENGSYELRALEIGEDEEVILDKTRSPYLIEKDIIVNSGGKLVIQAGVTILFNDENPSLIVNFDGSLDIEGEAANPIFFKSNKGIDSEWSSIVLEDDSIANINYAIFKNGGICTDATIIAKSSNLAIRNSKFYSSDSPGIFIEGEIDPRLENLFFDLGKVNSSGGSLFRQDDLIIQNNINANPYYSNLSTANYGHILILSNTQLGFGNTINRKISWNYPKVPYVINGWINIETKENQQSPINKASLNIKPQNKILFKNLEDPIEMKGSIHIKGESELFAEDTIFDSFKDNKWGSIYAMEKSIINLKGCTIKNAGSYKNNQYDIGALRIDTDSASISDTTIEDSNRHGLYLGRYGVTPRFNNLSILRSQGYAIYLEQNAKPIYNGIFQKDNKYNGSRVVSTFLTEENHWQKDEGPFHLDGLYEIKEDSSLFLHEGVQVLFSSERDKTASGILVENGGRIVALGTSNDPVNFTSKEGSSPWGSILLNENSMGRFNYSHFSNGGENDFEESPSRGNNNSNNKYGLISSYTNNLVVENSRFDNINNNAIYLFESANPLSIKYNLFNLNKGEGINNYGVYKFDKDSNTNASHNWWNDYTGPYNVINNPSGKGVLASHQVTFKPFLSSPTGRPNINSETIPSKITNDNLKAWTIRFNRSINPKYANTSFINIIDSNGNYLDIDVSLDPNNDKIINLIPKEQYIHGLTYKIIIKSQLETGDNNILTNDTIMEFKLN